MKTLHTISKTPTSNLLTSCLEAIAEDDGVLFLEDGVYYIWKDIKDLIYTEQYECYALKEDLLARGIEITSIKGVNLVDYPAFVDLVKNMKKSSIGFRVWFH